MMELERGIISVERKDTVQGNLLRYWFEIEVKRAFHHKTLKIDEHTAQIYAKLHIPNHTPENDAWIAASAIQHHLILVTRNTKDFVHTGVRLFNPFEK
ncbi:PIN domain-containing protein [Pelistega ratti]|uniref:PIN domain-containing protein n=1 Tax=Pelistega ratti TaxID=2652177 RepID=UPI001915E77C